MGTPPTPAFLNRLRTKMAMEDASRWPKRCPREPSWRPRWTLTADRHGMVARTQKARRQLRLFEGSKRYLGAAADLCHEFLSRSKRSATRI